MATNVPITGTIRPTPQNPTLGAIAAALRKAQEFTGQYEVDKRIPLLGGTSVDELLGLPGAAREVQAWSYGDYPVRINPNAGRTASFVPEIKPGRKSDVADTLFLGADVTPLGILAGKAVGRGARALEDATVGAAQRARVRAAASKVPEDTAYEPLRQRMEERGNLAYAVKPEGNINLQPALRAEALRGPDVQPIDAFVAQAKSTPGVTQDALREILSQYEDIAPGTKISKADFESRIPPSKFSKVDLYNDPDKAINNPLDYHLEEARDRVMENSDHVWEAVVDRLGLGDFDGTSYNDILDSLARYHRDEIGPEELPKKLRDAMARDGLLQDRQMFDSLVQEQIDDLVNETAYHMMQYDDTITTMSGYRYPEMQRLLPENVRNELSDNYFEFGVTHPDKADVSYRHYPNYESGEDGLVGHVRGTFIPADKTDAIAFVPSVGRGRAVIELKPKSVIIEEIQSDAQKGAFDAEQTGALRQVHGTLFKAAIDDALEKGATTVYYPTARTIAQVRGGDPRPYASIYDQQIMREGLKPLGKIPGVTINPIEAMMPGAPGTTPKPVVAYYEINFTPEAKEYILNGPGQLAPGYASGGAVKSPEEMTDEEYLARVKDLRPRQRAKPSSEEAKRAMSKQLPELMAEYLLPQDALDLGLMLLPGGKIARKVGSALIAGGATTEAEAGAAKKLATTGIAKLRELLQRESPEQAAAVRQALRESARTGKEVSVIGAADRPVGGRLVVGERDQVVPSAADRSAALLSDRPVLDMHTHPQGTMGVRPSKEDFAYYRDKYGSQIRSGAAPRELRTLIAQPPEPDIRARSAYNFFATDKPLAVFDPRRIDDARYELQRGAARGKFRSVQDDPLMREYFDYGGDIADLMDEAAALALLRHRAQQGLGRHELVLGGRSFTPNREASEQRLFDMITPEALELFRAKKMAEGGAVKFDPDEIAQMAEEAMSGYAAGGLVSYDPNEIDTIVSRMREEFHG